MFRRQSAANADRPELARQERNKAMRRERIMVQIFFQMLRELWLTYGAVFDPYRPERYYMRGPGPKWHAKRAGV
jgi:hypothetical protein